MYLKYYQKTKQLNPNLGLLKHNPFNKFIQCETEEKVQTHHILYSIFVTQILIEQKMSSVNLSIKTPKSNQIKNSKKRNKTKSNKHFIKFVNHKSLKTQIKHQYCVKLLLFNKNQMELYQNTICKMTGNNKFEMKYKFVFFVNGNDKLSKIREYLSEMTENCVEDIYFQLYVPKRKSNRKRTKKVEFCWKRIEKNSKLWNGKIRQFANNKTQSYTWKYRISYYPKLYKVCFH